MQVRFLSDYRGFRTNEQFYAAGDTAELADAAAEDLQARGVVEAFDEGAAPLRLPPHAGGGGGEAFQGEPKRKK